jgi:hypothetical protein
LYLDPSACTAGADDGCGVVKLSNKNTSIINTNVYFFVVQDSPLVLAIRQSDNCKIFLRLDGRGMTQGKDYGGGLVNFQYYSSGMPGMGGWETFKINLA